MYVYSAPGAAAPVHVATSFPATQTRPPYRSARLDRVLELRIHTLVASLGGRHCTLTKPALPIQAPR